MMLRFSIVTSISYPNAHTRN